MALGALACHAGGTASAAGGSGQEAPIGCWSIEVTAPEDPAVSRRLPSLIRLDPEPLEEGAGAENFTAWSIVDGEVRDHPFRAWRLLPGDSLWIGHPAAFAGATLRVALAGDTLSGVHVSYSDVGGAESRSRPARLIPAECPEGSGGRPAA